MNLRVLGSGPLVAGFLIAIVLSIVWAGALSPADPYYTATTGWNGTSELLGRGFSPISTNMSNSLSTRNPSILMILAPTRNFTRAEAGSIRNFVADGGVLVLADNFGTGNGLLKLLNISVSFDKKIIVDALFFYKQPVFPIVAHLPQSELSNGINQLVLNSAVSLNITAEPNTRILATSTPFSFLDLNHNGQKDSQEPSGPFPVLAELKLGQGSMLLFSSPASFTNSMIGLSDNSRLLQNIIEAGTTPSRTARLLDETHLTASASTPTRLLAKQLVASIFDGGMPGTLTIGLTALALFVVAARYEYRRPFSEKANKEKPPEVSSDVDSILQLHPSWKKAELQYVQREIEAAMRWRLREK